jgi:hypothetical protein
MADIVLGGNRFQVPPLPALRSFRLQPRIVPVFAEVAGLLFAVLSKSGIELKDAKVEDILAVDTSALPVAEIVETTTRVCLKLPPNELELIVRELLDGATMDGKPLFMGSAAGDPFNVFMQGRTLDTWRLLIFAVQVNFPDVFSRRGASGGATPAASSSAA